MCWSELADSDCLETSAAFDGIVVKKCYTLFLQSRFESGCDERAPGCVVCPSSSPHHLPDVVKISVAGITRIFSMGVNARVPL